MRVDYAHELDLATINLLLEHGQYSVVTSMLGNGQHLKMIRAWCHSLRRICRIYDGGLLGLIVADEVGIIVARARP
jgi:hypothetical protein